MRPRRTALALPVSCKMEAARPISSCGKGEPREESGHGGAFCCEVRSSQGCEGALEPMMGKSSERQVLWGRLDVKAFLRTKNQADATGSSSAFSLRGQQGAASRGLKPGVLRIEEPGTQSLRALSSVTRWQAPPPSCPRASAGLRPCLPLWSVLNELQHTWGRGPPPDRLEIAFAPEPDRVENAFPSTRQQPVYLCSHSRSSKGQPGPGPRAGFLGFKWQPGRSKEGEWVGSRHHLGTRAHTHHGLYGWGLGRGEGGGGLITHHGISGRIPPHHHRGS